LLVHLAIERGPLIKSGLPGFAANATKIFAAGARRFCFVVLALDINGLMMGLFGANDWFADCETVVKSSVVLRY
jgi:hypothetical protein